MTDFVGGGVLAYGLGTGVVGFVGFNCRWINIQASYYPVLSVFEPLGHSTAPTKYIYG